MTEIKLTKRYPQSRTEDITDAFMRGYQQGCEDGYKKKEFDFEAILGEMRAERQAIIKMLDSDVSNKQKLDFVKSFAKDWRRKQSKGESREQTTN